MNDRNKQLVILFRYLVINLVGVASLHFLLSSSQLREKPYCPPVVTVFNAVLDMRRMSRVGSVQSLCGTLGEEDDGSIGRPRQRYGLRTVYIVIYGI